MALGPNDSTISTAVFDGVCEPPQDSNYVAGSFMCLHQQFFFYDGLCWQQRRRLPFRLDNREGVTTREEWVKWEEVAFCRYGFTLMELLRARVKECCCVCSISNYCFFIGD